MRAAASAAAVAALWVMSRTGLGRSTAVPGSRPSALGAGEFAEAGRREERPVAGVVLADGILALQPGVVEEALDLRQPQPVRRLPQQPGCDSAATMPVGDAQVPDVGPPPVPGQPLSLLENLYLDVADRGCACDGRQAGAVHPERPPHGQ